MPQIQEVLSNSYKMKAGETTLSQGCVAVHTSTADECARPTGTTADKPVGVLRDAEHEAGKVQTYQVMGFTKVKISAAVSVGDKLTISGVDGRVRKIVNPVDAGMPVIGIAQEAATSANSKIIALLTIGQVHNS